MSTSPDIVIVTSVWGDLATITNLEDQSDVPYTAVVASAELNAI
jgi:hypothetical protein